MLPFRKELSAGCSVKTITSDHSFHFFRSYVNNRSKPSKHGPSNKQLASINFPKEMITYLDEMAEECGINRSSLVCLIVQDFKDSGKKIRFVVD